MVHGTAVGYMGAIKNLRIVKFKYVGCPLQLVDWIWWQYQDTLRSVKYNCVRKAHKLLCGTKDTATDHDKMGVIAVCIWSVTLNNTEFMNLYGQWLW